MATLSVEDKIQKARTKLVIMHPFFATLALRLDMVESADVETMATDGKNIYYNRAFVESMTDAEVQGVIAHEALHPGFLHHTRQGSRDQQKWNMAADYAINPIIEEAGMVLPEGCLVDAQYADKSAEEIYTLLPDPPKNGAGSGGRSWNIGGVMPASGDKEEIAEMEQEWKQTLAQAAHVAKMAGNLPASLQRFIDDTLATVTPWRDMLWSYLTEKVPDDSSFSRPNRRWIAQGIYLPSTIYTVTGDMAVMVDTSGSIGQHELNIFGAEINGIHQQIKPRKTYVIYCDAAINRVDEFEADDEITLTLCGGGGTDFRPPFDWLNSRGIVPHAAVYLTDGYGPFPEEQKYPVVWAINNRNVTPPFGAHVQIEE